MVPSRIAYSHLLLVLALAFLLRTSPAAGADPLKHNCSISGEYFASNSTYESNLNSIILSLKDQTLLSADYASASIWDQQNPNYTVHGQALCRGNASVWDCKTCVAVASGKIRKLCPMKKGAIIWYENCQLKYSNSDFLGKIDQQNTWFIWNSNDIRDFVSSDEIMVFLTDLAWYVTDSGRNRKMYYAAKRDIPYSTMTLHGLAQCTRDLSVADCATCLNRTIGELQGDSKAKDPVYPIVEKGGRALGGSCNARYETYRFTN